MKPVSLVGKSGGAWIVVRALEGLPAGSVESVVLLAAAVSPGHDLSRALRAVAREMVVFWSPLDLIVLGAGTWLFGTADRVRTRGAGLVGFRRPSGPGWSEAAAGPVGVADGPVLDTSGVTSGRIVRPFFGDMSCRCWPRADPLGNGVQGSSPPDPAPIT